MADSYFTLTELSKALGMTNRTVLRLIAAGKLTEGEDFYRQGKRLRFSKDALENKQLVVRSARTIGAAIRDVTPGHEVTVLLTTGDIKALAEAMAPMVAQLMAPLFTQQLEAISMGQPDYG